MAILKDTVQQTLATTTTGGALIAWFASTLPVLQWMAAFIAVVTGLIFLYGKFRQK